MYEAKVKEIEEIIEQKVHQVNYDITLHSTQIQNGSLSPITLIYYKLVEYFEKMNFDI
jgi:phenylalanyl-tRNA synthetase alpha subunit